jgi:hypothetical protein
MIANRAWTLLKFTKVVSAEITVCASVWPGAYMSLPIQLTRNQFESACKAYIAAESLDMLRYSPCGWLWREHPVG